MLSLKRRAFFVSLASVYAAASFPIAFAAQPKITVIKDPSCGCCTAWAKHLQENGFEVTLIDNPKKVSGLPVMIIKLDRPALAGYGLSAKEFTPLSRLRSAERI